jgi:predicted Zn-dependent protease
VEPFVAQAEDLLRNHQRASALALVHKAAAEPGGQDHWLDVAAVYAELGALSAATEALAHAGQSEDTRTAARELERARRRLGLPAGNPRFRIAPEQELELAEVAEDAGALVEAGKLAQARAAVAAGLRRFPRAPGLLVMSCEIALRAGKAREAAQRCADALAVMDDLPRAHYLLGRIQSDGRQAEAALRSLRRAVELDPTYRPSWDLLGEVYRSLGRQREFMKFLVEHPEAPAR